MANNPAPAMTEHPPALLLTRPSAASESFAAELARRVALGPVVVSPVLEIVAVPNDLDATGFAGVIVSSAHALAHYHGLATGPAFCVGARTTRAARAAGFDAVEAGATADALVAGLCADPPEGPLVHLRGRHSRGDVAERLTRMGVPVTEAILYDQQPRPLAPEAVALLDGERPVVLPLFSPRSAAILGEQICGGAPRWVVAISAAVSDAAAPIAPERSLVAECPDGAAMCAAVSALYPTIRPVEGRAGNA